ncbi:MAG: hypothetical protein MI794_20000 [Pseudomonadales bacterium]|uniref:hypothetical protein n=1 Tax=Marinobacter xestospongiae TaxID=994319 RepID=UPI002006BC23|nr:hypothetical protein [Marinobacter xestospongiae]MCG8520275.1 hypothetical protein [Pseudomonadales bacterium]MCK7567962.1 hypothetical protein [Marinobacter xestospongiae]
MPLKTGVALALLAVIYLGLFSCSSHGYGYAGYGGYHNGPSMWYFGGPRHYYTNQSIRNQSLGGPGDRGSGIHYGK